MILTLHFVITFLMQIADSEISPIDPIVVSSPNTSGFIQSVPLHNKVSVEHMLFFFILVSFIFYLSAFLLKVHFILSISAFHHNV